MLGGGDGTSPGTIAGTQTLREPPERRRLCGCTPGVLQRCGRGGGRAGDSGTGAGVLLAGHEGPARHQQLKTLFPRGLEPLARPPSHSPKRRCSFSTNGSSLYTSDARHPRESHRVCEPPPLRSASPLCTRSEIFKGPATMPPEGAHRVSFHPVPVPSVPSPTTRSPRQCLFRRFV